MENYEVMENEEIMDMDVSETIHEDHRDNLGTVVAMAIGAGVTIAVGAGVKLVKKLIAKHRDKKKTVECENAEVINDDSDFEDE